jgi:elongator complex protein 3
MRTISGVAIVAVMTSPESCPHGKCIPCPGGPDYNSPQSYTGYEPAAMRAIMHDFDPFKQVQARLNQIKIIGHEIDKIDLIIMGGTFTSRNPFYLEWFVKRCFDAMNNITSNSLNEAKTINETASSRCIGLTIETRPDWFRLNHLENVLNYGATRVELGIQTVYDDILIKMKRGHTVFDSIAATRIAKDAGLKVCYHIMPGLLGSNNKKDIEVFKTIFNNSDFKPDMLKIYPALVIKGTKLYDLWEKSEYEPLSTQNAKQLIAKIVDMVPEWIRIQRIQRDVPAQFIDCGVEKSNLRQLVDDELNLQGLKSKDIRSREIGHMLLNNQINLENVDIKLKTKKYTASKGDEYFISLETKPYNALIGFLRLRNINNPFRWELNENCMMIRELRVVGKEIGIGDSDVEGWQHKGFGKILLKEAEKISMENYDVDKLFVLSGVGVKNYYRNNHDFKDSGIYLAKQLI